MVWIVSTANPLLASQEICPVLVWDHDIGESVRRSVRFALHAPQECCGLTSGDWIVGGETRL